MQINRLIYFISVANHLNFTKAAQECHMAQPAISQQINSLEQELGFPLFVRNSKNVSLTEAGKVFYKEIYGVVEGYKNAVKRAESAAFGYTGQLTIGICGGIESLFLPQILKHFQSLYPKIEISFHKASFHKIAQDLKNQSYDVVFTWPYDLSEAKEIVCYSVFEDKACVMMNSEHQLANKNIVSRKELASEDNIMVAYGMHTKIYQHFNDFYAKYNLVPRKIIMVDDQSILNLMIDLNMGISIVPERVKNLNLPNITFSEIDTGEHFIKICAAYLHNTTNSCVNLFVKNITI